MKNLQVVSIKRTGERLKAIREQKGISKDSVQRMLKLTHLNPINEWERGAHLPSIDNLVALAQIYDVKLDDMIILSKDEPVHILDFENFELCVFEEAVEKCGYGEFKITSKKSYAPSTSFYTHVVNRFRSLLYIGDKDPNEVKADILRLVREIERG